MLAAIRAGVTMAKHVEDNQEDPAFPSIAAIRAYIAADSARISKLHQAREVGSDAMTDDSIYIADTVRDAQWASNRIKSRQWLASKMKPKVYGDKLDIDLTGKVDIGAAMLLARKRIESNGLIDVTPTPGMGDDIGASVLENHPPVDPFS